MVSFAALAFNFSYKFTKVSISVHGTEKNVATYTIITPPLREPGEPMDGLAQMIELPSSWKRMNEIPRCEQDQRVG